MRAIRILLCGLVGAGALAAAEPLVDTGEELLQFSRFEPLFMHGKPTAARGWQLCDVPRQTMNRSERRYLPGEECFNIAFSDDGMTIRYPDPLPRPYVKHRSWIELSSRVGWPTPPAPKYRVRGKVRFSGGALRLIGGGPKLKPGKWNEFDFVKGGPCLGFEILPEAGSEFTFGYLSTTAQYPAIGGAIKLPDGGELTRFLIPENADYVTRWSVALWRGWLWKLTGTALPIETTKELKPTPGAFVAIPGCTVPGGWDLTVDKNGVTLVYGEKLAVAPALFDYLRLGLGCAFYADDCVKLPETPVSSLPAIARQARPHYRHFVCGTPWMAMSGGWLQALLYARNDVDYYHLFEPRWDHIMNIIMPGELYFKDHPDYFMMDKKGHRYLDRDPRDTNPCFSNPAAVKTLIDNMMQYASNQTVSRRLTIETGDVWSHCQCPECVKFNGGPETNSESQWMFANQLAAELEKRHPDMILERAAYASRHTVPKHVKSTVKNLNVFYCLTGQVMPCTLHVDCEHNRPGLDEIAGWNGYLNGRREQLGFMTYLDTRPLQQIRQLEYLNRYGAGEVYFFDFHGFPASTHFTLARWNLGEDADKVMEEFDLNYYGAAGKIMHEITLLVDEYARNYQHKPDDLEGCRHIGIWGGTRPFTRSALDRAMFDKLYALFDQAFAAAKGDKNLERRISKELKLYMMEDFNRYPLNTCRNDAEIAAFAARLKRFIELARKYPAAFRRIVPSTDIRMQISSISGLIIPNTGKFWANEPALDKFLADPVGTLKAKPDRIPGGFYFKPLTIRGNSTPHVYSYQCPRRQCVGLLRPRFGSSEAEIEFTLDRDPAAPLFLVLEGLDDDKQGVSLLEVLANGHSIFAGPNRFPDSTWGRMVFPLPADTLKKGENKILLRCITPDQPSRSVRQDLPGEKDSQWGWINLSEAYVLDPNGDFLRYVARERPIGSVQPWHLGYENSNERATGTVVPGDDKVVITGAKGEKTGLVFFADHRNPKLAVEPTTRVRLTVEAAGEGNLRFQLWNYRAYPGKANDPEIPEFGYAGKTGARPPVTSKPFRLGPEKQTFSCVLTPAKGTGLVIPRVYLDGEGKATITKLEVDLL